jgi:hypothetical protein
MKIELTDGDVILVQLTITRGELRVELFCRPLQPDVSTKGKKEGRYDTARELRVQVLGRPAAQHVATLEDRIGPWKAAPES